MIRSEHSQAVITSFRVGDVPRLAVEPVRCAVACALETCALSVDSGLAGRAVVETHLVAPVHRSEIGSNFITIDNDYVMTADGRIFYILED